MDRTLNSTSSTSRRQVLAVAIPWISTSLVGCIENINIPNDETPTPTEESSGNTPTPEMNFDEMNEGSILIEVTVASGFSNRVILTGDCREAAIEIAPGNKASVTRDEDGEECNIQLNVNNETKYETHIVRYQSTFLTIREDGEINEESLVI